MTPELIGTLTFPCTQPLYNGRVGPYERTAGDWAYSIVCEVASSSAKTNIVAYKTPAQPDPNYGIVWTRVAAGPQTPNGKASVYRFDDADDVLNIGYQDTSSGFTGALQSLTFSMATETFSSPDPTGSGVISIVALMLLKLSNGDLAIFYDKSANGVFALVKSSGVWGSEITIAAGPRCRFAGALRVNDTNIKVLADHFSAVGFQNIIDFTCYTFDGSAVTGTSVAFTASGTDVADIRVGAGVYDAANDLVAWPIVNVVNATDNNQIFLLTGQASLAAPVFNDVLVYDDPDFGDSIGPPVQVIHVTAGFLVIFDLVPSDASPERVYTCACATLDGTWGAPVLFYDLAVDPPTPPPHNDVIFPVFAIENPDGTPGITIGLTMTVVITNFCGVLFFLPVPFVPPTPQTLTLIKIVNGGPAAPSDFTLTAVGGSPETEITGPGPQVGPTDVNAGTFELLESDPGGATWDGPNAKWDSPTFLWDGSGQYTPVWDCNGAPMPTPTSVVVSPGGGGAIPLGVTQVPDVDPTFAPLLSNGPFEFLVGGFFYQVLWNSGGRLGIFRRQASVGGSFTEIDATNAPTGISGYGRATLRGTIIAVCYMLPGLTTVKIVEFNTVSSGWGIPTAALTLLATTATFAFEKRSDGTYVFVAGRPNVVYYATNTGGAWSGTHILLTLGSGIVVLGGVIDSSDRIWLLLNTNSTTVGLYALSSSYVLGSSVATATLLFPGPPYPYIYYPQVALWGTDAVAVAYNTALTIGGAGVIRVKIGVGLSSPTFTSYDVYTVPAGTEQDYLMHPRDDGSGNLNLFFVHTNTGVVQVKQSTFDGASTWNTPSTFYDAVATPPFAGSASQAISTIDPVPSNGWAVGAAMQTDQPTEITTAEIIQESSGGGSSDVVCTVINYFTGPAPAPPGPGQMNPVGCFELLRVDATLMPARHLPVRGSTR